MAKTKQQSGSAAQRRAQERQQRQRRDDTRVATRSVNGPTRGPTVRKRDRSNLYMIVGVLALIVVVIGVLIFVRNAPAGQTNTNALLKASPADAAILAQLTTVPQSVLDTIGTGGSGVSNTFQGSVGGTPVLTGPNGHPEFLYVGAEYCPHCGAERWAMINALSRFGTFSNLSQIQAYEYNVSTFSFDGSKYTSQYVDFVPVEVYGNALDSTGQAYVPLQTMTTQQQQIFTKYNSAQSFPFMDVANQYTSVGATYQFTTLLTSDQSSSFTWQQIASALTNTKSPIAQAILGSANYITAALCKETNQQPGSACSSSVIQKIEQSLGKTSSISSPSSIPLTANSVPADLVAVQRRTVA